MAQTEAPPLPWAGWPDEIGCNFAAGHLVRNLGVPLTIEGRLHAETLMCAAGAIAGWGAHRSLMTGARTGQQVSMVTLNDGRTMLYGDAINDMLTSSAPPSRPTLRLEQSRRRGDRPRPLPERTARA